MLMIKYYYYSVQLQSITDTSHTEATDCSGSCPTLSSCQPIAAGVPSIGNGCGPRIGSKVDQRLGKRLITTILSTNHPAIHT